MGVGVGVFDVPPPPPVDVVGGGVDDGGGVVTVDVVVDDVEVVEVSLDVGVGEVCVII